VGSAQVLKDAMNSRFSSDITPETIAKLEREHSHLERIVFGGNAELECDNFDPFYDGVIFSVKPPKKSWRKISDLSGGEKIDAALDFRNVSIVANYIKERIRDAQFIVISLHDNMSELADHLVGVFKTDDQSKSVTFNPRKFQELTLSKILGKDPLNKKLCV
ncbi:3214_t:CDS:2, partial [Funneliformis geosporum]